MANPHPSRKYNWSSTPLALIPTPLHLTSSKDPYTHAATEIALVHNALIRALNTIYLQAPFIPSQLYDPFVAYSLACYQCVSAHYSGEQTFLFPELERLTGETGLMGRDVEQHTMLHLGVKTWGHWLESVVARRNSFSPDMCRSLMDDFLPAIHRYLTDRISALLELSRFGNKIDIRALSKTEGENVVKGLSRTTQLPALLLNHDSGFEGGVHRLPPVPGVVEWLLRRVCMRRKREWWRFASCGIDGRGRRLKFGGDVSGRLS